MADPLSITTGVLALLTICTKVGWGLKTFCDGAALANTKLASLLTDVESFTHVLQLMKDTFEQERVQSSLHVTGHIGGHWANLAASIRDGSKTLEQLEALLEKTNKSVRVLDATRKHLRLKEATDEIVMFQQQIRSYRDTLQLSLQTVILWNQVTFQESTDQILPNLDGLHKEIRRLAIEFNSRMSSLQDMVQQNSQDDQLETLTNLRNCVQSAATVVSSASTILGVESEQSVLGSDFGDIFPSEPNETMLRWMSSNTVYEYEEEHETAETPTLGGSSYLDATDATRSEDVDSNDALEEDIFEALLASANAKIAARNYGWAEGLLKNCMSRIPGPSGTAKYVASQIEIGKLLLMCYLDQEKFDDAISLLVEKMSLELETDESAIFRDNRILANLLMNEGQFSVAMTYGRKALKGYRRLGPSHTRDVHDTLVLLVKICYHDEDENGMVAYEALLEDLKKKHPDVDLVESSPAPIITKEEISQIPQQSASAEPKQLDSLSPQDESAKEESSQIKARYPASASELSYGFDYRDTALLSSKTISNRCIMFVGDAKCGKSAFITRVRTGSFPDFFDDTLSRQQLIHPLKGSGLVLTCDNIKTSVEFSYCRADRYIWAYVVIICFAVDDQNCIQNVRRWLREAVRLASKKSPFVLLRLKCDLREKKSETPFISSEKIFEAASSITKVTLFECSAKTGVGIDEAIRAICAMALQPR